MTPAKLQNSLDGVEIFKPPWHICNTSYFLSYHSSLPLIQPTATRVGTGESAQGKTTLKDIKASVHFSKAFRVSYLMLSAPLMAFMNLKMHISLQHSLPVTLFRMQMQFNTIRQDRKPRPFYRINCIPVAGQDKETPVQQAGWTKARYHLRMVFRSAPGFARRNSTFPKGIKPCYSSTCRKE